jgi:hypothetical protein
MSVPSETVIVLCVFEVDAPNAMEETRKKAGRLKRSETRCMECPQGWTRSVRTLRAVGLMLTTG